MKVKDLMIGDWVMLCLQPIQVFGIKMGNDEESFYITNQYGGSHHIKLIEPIPLTEEILKKNGFIKHVFGFYMQGFRLYGNLSDNDLVYFTINIDKMEIRIDYVHELQHALRLCGIEKEIIL